MGSINRQKTLFRDTDYVYKQTSQQILIFFPMVFLTDSKRENCGILCLSVTGVLKKLAASCYETYPNKLYHWKGEFIEESDPF